VELSEKDGGVLFQVKAQPRSSKSRICGEYGGRLKVTLKAPPVDDAANRECCALFAKLFGVAPSRLSIVAGMSSRNKTVRVEGISFEEVARILLREGAAT
jgi:uncharacterized protein